MNNNNNTLFALFEPKKRNPGADETHHAIHETYHGLKQLVFCGEIVVFR